MRIQVRGGRATLAIALAAVTVSGCGGLLGRLGLGNAVALRGCPPAAAQVVLDIAVLRSRAALVAKSAAVSTPLRIG